VSQATGIGLDLCLFVRRLTSNYRATEVATLFNGAVKRTYRLAWPPSVGFARCAEHECRAPRRYLSAARRRNCRFIALI
jgi:hypothetical protein